MIKIPDTLAKVRDDYSKNADEANISEGSRCCESCATSASQYNVRVAAQRWSRNGFDVACAELLPVIEEMRKVLKKGSVFLDEEIAMLQCTSRERYLPEETWESAMYIRDIQQAALEATDKILGDTK